MALPLLHRGKPWARRVPLSQGPDSSQLGVYKLL